MTPHFVRRAGASILCLEVGYLLLVQLAMAVFMVDTSEIDHTETHASRDALLLAAEAAAVLVLLWAAAQLALPSFADKGPTWARVTVLGIATLLQVFIVWAATTNALAQDAGPDVLINGVMVLCALTASVACLLGVRGEFRRALAVTA